MVPGALSDASSELKPNLSHYSGNAKKSTHIRVKKPKIINIDSVSWDRNDNEIIKIAKIDLHF